MTKNNNNINNKNKNNNGQDKTVIHGVKSTAHGSKAQTDSCTTRESACSMDTKNEICFHLIQELFCHGYEGYWYTLLPNGEGLADILHALGVEWHYLLPLLQFLGLITTTVTSMDKRTVILHWQVMQMKNAIQKYKKCEVTVMQLKHCK